MRARSELIRDGNDAGEFAFVESGLLLSFQLTPRLELELDAAGGHWSGRTFRGDLKVMLPGERRIFRHTSPASPASGPRWSSGPPVAVAPVGTTSERHPAAGARTP